MSPSIRLGVLTGIAVLPVCLVAGPSSAQAGRPSLSVSKASDVNPDGERVTVTGRGFAAGGGVYVQFCPTPTGALGTAAGRASNATGCNPDQSEDRTIWKTPVPASGEFTVELNVQARFGSTDCTKVQCGVFTRKDHDGGASDYSQDAFTPVSFRSSTVPTAAAPPASLAPPAAPAAATPVAPPAPAPAGALPLASGSSGQPVVVPVGASTAATPAPVGPPPAVAVAAPPPASSAPAAAVPATTGAGTVSLTAVALLLLVSGALARHRPRGAHYAGRS